MSRSMKHSDLGCGPKTSKAVIKNNSWVTLEGALQEGQHKNNQSWEILPDSWVFSMALDSSGGKINPGGMTWAYCNYNMLQ
jgi:hypothetical protein